MDMNSIFIMKRYSDFHPESISIYLKKNTVMYNYCVLYDRPSLKIKYQQHSY